MLVPSKDTTRVCPENTYKKITFNHSAGPKGYRAGLLVLADDTLIQNDLNSQLLKSFASCFLQALAEPVHAGLAGVNQDDGFFWVHRFGVRRDFDACSTASDDNDFVGTLNALLHGLQALHALQLFGGIGSRRKALFHGGSGGDDEVLVWDVLAAILELHMGLGQRRDSVLHPVDGALRSTGQVGAVWDEGLVLVALCDAVSGENPGELEVGVRFDDDNPISAVGRQVQGKDSGGLVSREVGSHDDNIEISSLGGFYSSRQ